MPDQKKLEDFLKEINTFKTQSPEKTPLKMIIPHLVKNCNHGESKLIFERTGEIEVCEKCHTVLRLVFYSRHHTHQFKNLLNDLLEVPKHSKNNSIILNDINSQLHQSLRNDFGLNIDIKIGNMVKDDKMTLVFYATNINYI